MRSIRSTAAIYIIGLVICTASPARATSLTTDEWTAWLSKKSFADNPHLAPYVPHATSIVRQGLDAASSLSLRALEKIGSLYDQESLRIHANMISLPGGITGVALYAFPTEITITPSGIYFPGCEDYSRLFKTLDLPLESNFSSPLQGLQLFDAQMIASQLIDDFILPEENSNYAAGTIRLNQWRVGMADDLVDLPSGAKGLLGKMNFERGPDGQKFAHVRIEHINAAKPGSGNLAVFEQRWQQIALQHGFDVAVFSINPNPRLREHLETRYGRPFDKWGVWRSWAFKLQHGSGL